MAEPATPTPLTVEELLLIAMSATDYYRALAGGKDTVDELLAGSLRALAELKGHTIVDPKTKPKYHNYSATKGPGGRRYMSSDGRDVLLSVFGLSRNGKPKTKFTYASGWLQALGLFGFGDGEDFPAKLKAAQLTYAEALTRFDEKKRATVVFDAPPVPAAVPDPVPGSTPDAEPEPDALPVPGPDADAATLLGAGGAGDTLLGGTTPLDVSVPTNLLPPEPPDEPESEPEDERPAPTASRRAPARRSRKSRLPKVARWILRRGIPLLLVVAAVGTVFEIPVISNFQQQLPFQPPVRADMWAKLNPEKVGDYFRGNPEDVSDVDWAKADALGLRIESRIERLATLRKELSAARDEFKAEGYRKRLGTLYPDAYKGEVTAWLEFESLDLAKFAVTDAKRDLLKDLRNKVENRTALRSEIQKMIDLEKEVCELLGVEWRANARGTVDEATGATKGAEGHLNRARRLRGLIQVSPPRDTDRTIDAIIAEKK